MAKKLFHFKLQDKLIEIEFLETQTTQDLLQTVRMNPKTPSPANLVGFKSLSSSITLDYVLSLNRKEFGLQLKYIRNQDWFLGLYCTEKPSNSLSLQDFVFEKCIGKGGTSEVFLVRHKFSTRLFALKMIKKQYVSDCRRLEQILRERKILSETLKRSKDCLCFLLEFSPGGELFYHLQNYRFDEPQVKIYFCEVLCALEDLHGNKVLYRDLKPENILIDFNGHLCLTDFGLSKLGLQEDQMTYSFCGSPEYMPPEIVVRQGYSYAADFYTLGCLLYELLVGLPPHYSQDTEEIFQNIQQKIVTYPDDLSQEVIDLMQMLLAKDPVMRLQKFANLKDARWLREIDWDLVRAKRYQAPIQLDLYESNIHDEFLEINVDELNSRNRKGELKCEENLFSFFDYVNSEFSFLFEDRRKVLSDQPLTKNRVCSDHTSASEFCSHKKKKSLQLANLEAKTINVTSTTRANNAPLITFSQTNIMPQSLLRKSFQNMLRQNSGIISPYQSIQKRKSNQASERGKQDKNRVKSTFDHYIPQKVEIEQKEPKYHHFEKLQKTKLSKSQHDSKQLQTPTSISQQTIIRQHIMGQLKNQSSLKTLLNKDQRPPVRNNQNVATLQNIKSSTKSKGNVLTQGHFKQDDILEWIQGPNRMKIL